MNYCTIHNIPIGIYGCHMCIKRHKLSTKIWMVKI